MSFSLDAVESYLRDRILPQANTLDQNAVALRAAFLALGQQRWLGLKIPAIWGGYEVNAIAFQQFQEAIARVSGALAFLQAQHQSAGAFISRSQNHELKQEYLPRMAMGEIAVGVGFSHLRRAGSPLLKALPVEGGYQLHGTIPWITGYSIFQWFIGAAVLPDDCAVYGMMPFVPQQTATDSLHFSDPMALAAMTATNTVTATLNHWFLPQTQVLFTTPANAIHHNDVQNVLQHSFYALGCARAGLDVVEQVAQRRSQPFLHTAYAALNQELTTCRQAIYQAAAQSFGDRLQLRAWAIELAGRCAHAAVAVSAGAANSLHHPAQRIYRESLVFTVAGQTPAVMEATLHRLTRSKMGHL
ncbi:MAG: acyl-CoA/acyl-ACP dehydrogenase [Oscillatoriales cyanobacterium C42_A2020_001]|nr:acyl-CoA/acyl-ACP dehydrogenase [Leptolyngbyaceae cyanobacterium C42_A2020_001]